MRPGQLTRREVLAGVAGATGVGAAFGTGTAAYMSDVEVFEQTRVTSGTLDLLVKWETDGESGSSHGDLAVPVELTAENPTQIVDLSLSVGDDATDNPAYAWVRSTCPEDDGLAQKLDITLRFSDCDTDCVLYSGPLSGLADGTSIDAAGGETTDPGRQNCLEPGQELDLQMEIGLSNFQGHGSASVTLKFVGTQCRHSEGVEGPFQTVPECEDNPDDSQHAISYIAFCTTSEGPIEPELEVLELTDDGPHSVAWTTTVDVRYVAVKAANKLTIYDYSNDSQTSGTATSGDETAALPDVGVAPGEAATPCAVATQELGSTSEDVELTTTKLEYENGSWSGDAK